MPSYLDICDLSHITTPSFVASWPLHRVESIPIVSLFPQPSGFKEYKPQKKWIFRLIIPAGIVVAQLIQIVIPSGVASADQISNTRAEAAAIASKINQLNVSLNALAEQYDQATVQLQNIQSKIATTHRSINRDQTNVAGLKKKLANEAVSAFTQAGTVSLIMSFVQGTATDASVAREYMNTISSSQQNLVAQYESAKNQLLVEQKSLASEQVQANSTVNRLASAKAAAQTATAQEHQQLQSVNGKLAELVAAAQLAQQRAAQARAQALLLQQKAIPLPAPNQTNNKVVFTAAGESQIATALQWARAEVGKPYVFGTDGPNAFDCSGLVQFVFGKAGISLAHYTGGQYDETSRIGYAQLQPGDLVFYYSGITHVSIYIGGGQVISAENEQIGVAALPLTFDGVPVAYGRVS